LIKFSFEGTRNDLCSMLRCLCVCPEPIIVRQAIAFNGVVFQATGEVMSLTVKDTEVPGTVTVSVAFTDAKGKPAAVDGVPTWTVDNATVVDSLTPAADGMSATLHVTDNLGAAVLSVNADADLGSGVTNITISDTVTVIAGDAVAGNFTFGTVTPDAAPTP
jgi:hypothetical protein